MIYQEDEALINIITLEILEGKLPNRAKTLVIEWAIEHRNELLANWQKASYREPLDKIMIKITDFKLEQEKKIHFYFNDGTEKTIDFSPFVGEDSLSKPLSDPAFFSKVKLIENGRGIFWPNDFDFCPDFLHQYQEYDEVKLEAKQ